MHVGLITTHVCAYCQAREASRHPQRSNGTATSSIGGTSFGADSTAGSLYGGSQHGSRHGSPVSTPRLGTHGSGGGGTGGLHVHSFVVSMASTPSGCFLSVDALCPCLAGPYISVG